MRGARRGAGVAMSVLLDKYLAAVRGAELARRSGRVAQYFGLVIESIGPEAFLGEVCEIRTRGAGAPVGAEVVGVKDGKVLLMPYGELHGIAAGSEVVATGHAARVPVGEALLGRVIDAFGRPLDGRPLHAARALPRADAHNPLQRARVSQVLETGVRCIDCLLTLGKGQRVGIFSGSGVGKSTLLGMIARNVTADVNVIALVGERGREVLEFIERNLGAHGLARSVVVVATSDQPALTRVRAAYAATAIAEDFRDRGRDVMLIMDSITRFAMAQREIGLAVGEPPTARGYTPSVFAALPRLLERAGTSAGRGATTAVYTVLVEGDDINDPVADSMRAVLDGHIVLSRELANHGRYPAIDVLNSASRLLADLASAEERALALRAVSALGAHARGRDLVDVGAYRAGANPELDAALRVVPELERWLRQDRDDTHARAQGIAELRRILEAAA
jgi:flagellum-specific ATP synthase